MTVCLAVCLSAGLHKYYCLDLSLKSHKLGHGLTKGPCKYTRRGTIFTAY